MKQNAEQADLDIVEFNNMMDIMKELADILGVNNDDLKKILDNGSIKFSHNGKPIIDIENGVDKLAPKNDDKKDSAHTEPKTNYAYTVRKKEPKEVASSAPCDNKTCSCTDTSYKYPEWTTSNNIWLNNNNILIVNPDEFIIADEVAGYPIFDSQTEITFSHRTPDGWVPGITNNQLLAILCERFKKDPKKVETLKALMNS